MPVLVFRSSFAVLWRWTGIVCGIAGIIVYGTALATGASIPLGITFALALAIGAVFAVTVICYPVYVRMDGIRCYNFYGFYRTLLWEEFAQVRRTRVVGLPYLVACDPEGAKEIWIPLYLSDMPKFVGAVRAGAGDGHILTMAIGKYGD